MKLTSNFDVGTNIEYENVFSWYYEHSSITDGNKQKWDKKDKGFLEN